MNVATAEDVISYGGRLAVLAAERPDDTAVVALALDGSETALTWAQFERRANQIGRAMAERSVVPGDRVALALPNSCDAVAAIFATWKLGAVPVPVRWDLPDWERGRILEVVDAALVVGTEDHDWLAASTSLDDGPLDGPVSPHTHGICSSGSTGLPKMILMENPAVWNPEIGKPFVEGWKEVPRPQTVLMATTLYHTNGFATMLNVLAGDTLVTLEKFDAARIVDLVERHRVTTITATPTMLQRIVDLPGVDDRDLSSLEWVLQGAAVIPPSLVHRVIELIGAERFFMAYGMTEGLGLTALRADEWLTHQGSVGRGYRGTEVRIADASGEPVPSGEIGEIYLRSPMSGMYRYVGGAPPLPTTDDGFSTAGDMGWMDEDGYLYIADRRVDMIITGGANVFPAEVESALVEHPEIVDVVVIGLSDPEWGRRVHAIVEPRDSSAPPDAAEVIAFAKTRLAAYKVPKSVEVVERIPRSASTKISRAALIAERGG
ncbi:MAG: AMP-binding protein [Acidimicrobiales bacterium]|nr:AMP-binding protein [Acidimicrobiales bacterium]